MHAVVFVGPSLARTTIPAHSSVRVRPPIGRGELDDLVRSDDPPAAVGIVDGRFWQDLAVTPKEVLRALDAGVAVYGSSSMGALRAVECQRYGAIGVGVIFRMFADGELEADDEVAISYDPDTLQPTSEPLANLRIAFARAATEAVVTPATAEAAVLVARRLYFPNRSYQNVLRSLAPHVPPGELAALAGFVSGVRCPDQKRDDAVELFASIVSATAGTRPVSHG